MFEAWFIGLVMATPGWFMHMWVYVYICVCTHFFTKASTQMRLTLQGDTSYIRDVFF